MKVNFSAGWEIACSIVKATFYSAMMLVCVGGSFMIGLNLGLIGLTGAMAISALAAVGFGSLIGENFKNISSNTRDFVYDLTGYSPHVNAHARSQAVRTNSAQIPTYTFVANPQAAYNTYMKKQKNAPCPQHGTTKGKDVQASLLQKTSGLINRFKTLCEPKGYKNCTCEPRPNQKDTEYDIHQPHSNYAKNPETIKKSDNSSRKATVSRTTLVNSVSGKNR